jgi:hypothetical protein
MYRREEFMPGARNPKMARFSLNVTEAVDQRVGALADAAQANKGTIAALALVAGLNLLERVYLVGLEKYQDQVVSDQVAQLGVDLRSAMPAPD